MFCISGCAFLVLIHALSMLLASNLYLNVDVHLVCQGKGPLDEK